VAELLGKPASECNIISLNIGSGEFACAIKHVTALKHQWV